MNRIGFFGGCFNPPNNTHINLANKLVTDKIVDKVVFVPVGDYYTKTDLMPSKHRYNMLDLACEDIPSLEVEDIACRHKDKLYTIDTLKLINNKYAQDNEVYFIMGSDNFKKMPSWKEYNNIKNEYKFIVLERPNFKGINILKNVIYYKNFQIDDISSTKIRKMLKNNQDVNLFLNPKVLEYIKLHNLYI